MTALERAKIAVENVQGHMASVGRQKPTAWRDLDKTAMMRNNGTHLILPNPESPSEGPIPVEEHWPKCCFLPVLVYSRMNPLQIEDRQLRHSVYPLLISMAAWRRTQSVYVFDDTLANELWETPIAGELPVELFERLPVQAPMIVLPAGAFASADGGGEAVICQMTMIGQYRSLLIMLLTGLNESSCISIPMLETLDKSIDWIINILENEDGRKSVNGVLYDAVGYDLAEKGKRSDGKSFALSVFKGCRKDMHGLFSMILYLCSEEPEVDKIPKQPQVVKTKHGPRIFPAEKPTYVNVGIRLGALLKKSRTEPHSNDYTGLPTGHTVAPHIRRAHWHLYWTGPRSTQRVPKVKWLSAIAVNTKFGEIETVVHPVRVLKKESK